MMILRILALVLALALPTSAADPDADCTGARPGSDTSESGLPLSLTWQVTPRKADGSVLASCQAPCPLSRLDLTFSGTYFDQTGVQRLSNIICDVDTPVGATFTGFDGPGYVSHPGWGNAPPICRDSQATEIDCGTFTFQPTAPLVYNPTVNTEYRIGCEVCADGVGCLGAGNRTATVNVTAGALGGNLEANTNLLTWCLTPGYTNAPTQTVSLSSTTGVPVNFETVDAEPIAWDVTTGGTGTTPAIVTIGVAPGLANGTYLGTKLIQAVPNASDNERIDLRVQVGAACADTAGAEERCDQLGSVQQGGQCICSEPLEATTHNAGMTNWEWGHPQEGGTYAGYFDLDDSPGDGTGPLVDTECWDRPDQYFDYAGSPGAAIQFCVATPGLKPIPPTAPEVAGKLPPGHSLTSLLKHSGDGVCSIATPCADFPATGGTVCTRHYRMWGGLWDADYPGTDCENAGPDARPAGGKISNQLGAAVQNGVSVGSVGTQIAFDMGTDDQGIGRVGGKSDSTAFVIGAAYHELGTVLTVAPNSTVPVAITGGDCVNNLCRFEHCLDYFPDGTIQTRRRMVEAAPGSGEVHPLAGTVTHQFTGATYPGTISGPVIDASGPHEWRVRSSPQAAKPGGFKMCGDYNGGLVLFNACNGDAGWDVNTHLIMTQGPLDTSFWPGPACEVEGNCGGAVNAPPVIDSMGGPYLITSPTTQKVLAATVHDDGPLTYAWSDNCTEGSFSSSTVEDPTYTLTAEKICTLTLTISDGVNAPVTSTATFQRAKAPTTVGTEWRYRNIVAHPPPGGIDMICSEPNQSATHGIGHAIPPANNEQQYYEQRSTDDHPGGLTTWSGGLGIDFDDSPDASECAGSNQWQEIDRFTGVPWTGWFTGNGSGHLGVGSGHFSQVTHAAEEAPYLPLADPSLRVMRYVPDGGALAGQGGMDFYTKANTTHCIRQYRRFASVGTPNFADPSEKQWKILTGPVLNAQQSVGWSPTTNAECTGLRTPHKCCISAGVGNCFTGGMKMVGKTQWNDPIYGINWVVYGTIDSHQCSDHWCRFEHCLDVNAQGVATMRERYTVIPRFAGDPDAIEVTHSNPYHGTCASADNYDARELCGSDKCGSNCNTNADCAGRPAPYNICNVEEVVTRTVPHDGSGPTYWRQAMNPDWDDRFSHFMDVRINGVNPNFWIGPACELEGTGGAGGCPAAP